MQQIQENQDSSGSQAAQILHRRLRDGTLKEVWQDWKWILAFSRGRWASIVLYTLFGIGSSGIALASGVVSKYLIDCIVSFQRQRLLPLGILMVLTGALSVGFRALTARFSARLSITMQNDVQRRVFDKLLTSQWIHLRRYPTGDLMNRLSADVSTVAGCAVSWLPNVLIQVFTLLSTLAVVLYYDPVMALIAFASTPVLIFASRRLLRRQRSFNSRMRSVSSGMSAFQAETFRNLDTLKSFGVEDKVSERLRQWQADYEAVSLAYNNFSIRTNLLLTAMGTAVQYIALGYCLWRLWSGEILFGTMVLFLQQRANLSAAFSALISLVPQALSGSVAAERIQELTQLPQEERQEAPAAPAGQCSLEMVDVCAAYEDGRTVLENVSLRACAGEMVALVGPSGEGKSTLIRLMLGLMAPVSGQARLVDSLGTPFPLGADTRHLFAYVPQGNTVLSGTIADNLRLVNPQVSQEEMIRALEDACAWDFVRELPQGIHTPLGEGGKGLSEGQAQRIAIARALVRKAPVLLLDEVTSALDADTEKKVLDNLMRRGLTCIAATHRTTVLGMCHRIYRVRDGRVERL